MDRFQTGIDIFDTNTGGIYPGLVLLVEETGAGGKEFALTSLMNLSRKGISGDLVYVSLTATSEEMRREFLLSFPHSGEDWVEKVKTVSLSKEYFARTIIPISWVLEGTPTLSSLKSESLLERLIDIFESFPPGSLIVIDSLTSLARKTDALGGDEIAWKDLIDLLIGIRKMIIKKELLTLVLLTKGVVGRSKEEEIFSTADGIIMFEWMEEKETMRRIMYVKRMIGTLSVLEKQRFTKFDVSIDPASGFTISKLHRII